MANYDATNTNKSSRNAKIYKDLDLDFGRNSVTNDVNKLEDAEAVKRSVRNLINTSHYERPFHPELGSNVRAMLFEPMTPLTALNLQRKVQEVLVNFEPRAKLVQIIATPDIDRNAYGLQVSFYVIGIPTNSNNRIIFREIKMSRKLEVSELDFDNIKANLKLFLSKQNQFSDYDFEGSGMAVLLDILAYNTHYLSFNANMLANEMYIDSADTRKNIVSLGKLLGYTPTSLRETQSSNRYIGK